MEEAGAEEASRGARQLSTSSDGTNILTKECTAHEQQTASLSTTPVFANRDCYGPISSLLPSPPLMHTEAAERKFDRQVRRGSGVDDVAAVVAASVRSYTYLIPSKYVARLPACAHRW